MNVNTIISSNGGGILYILLDFNPQQANGTQSFLIKFWSYNKRDENKFVMKINFLDNLLKSIRFFSFSPTGSIQKLPKIKTIKLLLTFLYKLLINFDIRKKLTDQILYTIANAISWIRTGVIHKLMRAFIRSKICVQDQKSCTTFSPH